MTKKHAAYGTGQAPPAEQLPTWTDPNKLVALCLVACLLFAAAYWPKPGQAMIGAVIGRRAGPQAQAAPAASGPAAVAATSQQPQQQPQQPQQLQQPQQPQQPQQQPTSAAVPEDRQPDERDDGEGDAGGRAWRLWPSALTAGQSDGYDDDGDDYQEEGGEQQDPGQKVQLELSVMGNCADSSFCEHVFDKLLDTFEPIVHVSLSYIQEERDGKMVCRHGEEECAANLNQLCVGKHTPPQHNHDWLLKFLVCSWDSGMPQGGRDVVRTCLEKIGAPGEYRKRIEACIDGDEGRELMRATARSTSERGIERSCTVLLEGRKRCVRDQSRWVDCPAGGGEEDFARSICAAYREKNGRDADVCKGVAV